METNGEIDDILHNSKNIYILFIDFWTICCPWLLLTIAMLYVTTLKGKENIFTVHVSECFAIKMNGVVACTKLTLYITYVTCIVLCAITLNKFDIERQYTLALFSAIRYVSCAVQFFVLTKIRLVLISPNKDQRVFKSSDNNHKRTAETSAPHDKEFLNDQDSGCEQENLDGIQFDGYFCYKYVVHDVFFQQKLDQM